MFSILLNTILSGHLAFACSNDSVSTDRHTLQIMTVDKGRGCLISASPRSTDQTRRKFILNDQGMLMVMVENPKGSASKNTGSQTYHVVPVTTEMKITDRNANPGFQDAAGLIWHAEGSDWKSDACEIKVVGAPTLDNKGAYEILNCTDRFVIDSGFKRGGTARDNRKGKSTITAGKLSCQVSNSEIFDYKTEEPRLKIQTSAQIQEFLKSKPACAGLLKEFSSSHKKSSGSE